MDEYVSNNGTSGHDMDAPIENDDDKRFKNRDCRYRTGNSVNDTILNTLLNTIIRNQEEHGRELKNGLKDLSDKIVGWENFRRLEERQKILETKVDDLSEVCTQFETLKPSLTTESLLKDAKMEAVTEADQNAKDRDDVIIKSLDEIKQNTDQIKNWTQIFSFTIPALMKHKVVFLAIISALVSIILTPVMVVWGRIGEYGLKETLLLMFAIFCCLFMISVLIIIWRTRGDPKQMKAVFLSRILIIFLILLIPCFAQDLKIGKPTNQDMDVLGLPEESFLLTSDHPIILPSDQLQKVTNIIINPSAYGNPLQEENILFAEYYNFLHIDDNLNITYMNNSTSLFYA